LRRRRFLSLLCALAVAACGGVDTHPRPPNVLLVSIDALRADRVGAYGYGRPTSPFLDHLAAGGLVFENAFVNTHGTTPSHTTILSGLHQETHRVGFEPAGRTEGGVVLSRIPDSVPLVQELLRDRGYTTIGVTDGGNAGDAFGFARGFDHFDDRGGGVEKVTRRARRFIEEAGAAAPLFVFLHTYEVHSPYDPPQMYRDLLDVPPSTPAATSAFLLEHAASAASTLAPGELEAISRLYDAEIRLADDTLRAWWSELEAIGFLRDAVVIVTSDHGEEFGEHGGLLHRDLLYDVLIKVPLLVAGRGIEPGRRDQPVSSVDIAPTILDLAGAPQAAQGMEGASLREPRRRSSVVSQYGTSRYALRTREWKLIWSGPGAIELFRMREDPGERENVAERHPDVRDTLLGALERWRRDRRPGIGQGAPVELDEGQWRELESLGYVR
jgi:arylsulfatase A-like enzyme